MFPKVFKITLAVKINNILSLLVFLLREDTLCYVPSTYEHAEKMRRSQAGLPASPQKPMPKKAGFIMSIR